MIVACVPRPCDATDSVRRWLPDVGVPRACRETAWPGTSSEIA